MIELETFKVCCRAYMPECKFDAHPSKSVVTAYINEIAVARWVGVYNIPELRAWLKDEIKCEPLDEKKFIKKLKKIALQL